MNEHLNFEQDIKVDKNDLEYEWSRQPSLYGAWQKELIDEKLALDRIKEKMELVEARLTLDVRKHPDVHELKDKPSEAIIHSVVILNVEYQEAFHKYILQKHTVGVLQVGVNSLEHKKAALENLVRLAINDKWAEPRMTKEDKEQVSVKHDNALNRKKEE